MGSKVQLLKDAIDVHSTLRYLQRKLNLEGFRYRRMCTEGDDSNPLLEAKTAGKERLEVNNEIFHLSKMDPLLKDEIPQQENAIQKNNSEFKVKGFRHDEPQDQASGGEPTQTKTVQMLQLESKPKDFLDSKSYCHEHLNSSLEIRELATRGTVRKGPLESKPRGLLDSSLSCHEYSNSVSELEIPGTSITAQQKVSKLKNEGFFEIKISRTENLELSPEFRKSISGAQLESNKSCEDRDPLSQFRTEPGDTKTLRKERFETKVAGFLDRKSSCDENSEFSSEVRTLQLTKTKPVQPKDLQLKPESIHCIKDPSNVQKDSFSDVPKLQHLKTIRSKDLEFKPKSFQDSKKSCHESQDPFMPLGKSPLSETVQPNILEFKADGVHCSNSSSHEDSKYSSGGKVSRNLRKARKKKKMDFKSQGFHYSELPCNEAMEVKKKPEMKKPVQTKKSTPVHAPVCKVPSWQDDEIVRAKLAQRRSAVCDKIEKELLNQYGISLRNLRKYMVIDEILKEVNLL